MQGWPRLAGESLLSGEANVDVFWREAAVGAVGLK